MGRRDHSSLQIVIHLAPPEDRPIPANVRFVTNCILGEISNIHQKSKGFILGVKAWRCRVGTDNVDAWCKSYPQQATRFDGAWQPHFLNPVRTEAEN